jgi:hypothetical protein
MGRKVQESDSYLEALLKLIPSEIVTLYLAASALIVEQDQEIHWILAVIFVIATPLWLYRFSNIAEGGLNLQEWLQLGASTGAMIVWVFSLGGPFGFEEWYVDNQEILVPLVLLIYTGLIAPILLGKKPKR